MGTTSTTMIDWIQSGTQLHTTTKATFGGQGFGLLEYKDGVNNAFVNLSAVSQGYRRVDYFSKERDEEGVPNSSVWHNIPGYTLKLGGNRKFTEFTNAFVNLGVLNRTPVFRNVFDFSNELFANIKNEVIYSFDWEHREARAT